MLTISARLLFCYTLVFVLLAFHASADARLIRGRGSGGVTVSFGSLDFLVPVSEINEFGLLNYAYFQTMPLEDQVGVIPPGYPMVQGVPDDCFVPLGSGQVFEDDPCYWLFSVNESLLITGSTVAHFASAIQNITWQIFESGVDTNTAAPLYEFDNSHTEIDSEVIFSTNEPNKALHFAADMPDLAPGEYQIKVNMQQLAPAGYVFYSADVFNTEEACFGEPGNEICSRFGGVTGTTFSRFAIERLVVVSEPTAMFLLMVFLLFIRQRFKPCKQ